MQISAIDYELFLRLFMKIFVNLWHGMVEDVLTAFPDQRVFSKDEQQRRDDFQFERDQRSFTAAHILARNMLSEYANIAPENWQFETSHYGRPEIKAGLIDKSLFFNISHKQDAVCCLVSNIPECGVDLEDHSHHIDWPEVGKQVFTPGELLYCGNDDKRFRNLWCLKEAYMKATGLGFHMDPLSCNINMGNQKITLEKHPDWQFQLHNIEGRYTIAATVHASHELNVQFRKIKNSKLNL